MHQRGPVVVDLPALAHADADLHLARQRSGPLRELRAGELAPDLCQRLEATDDKWQRVFE